MLPDDLRARLLAHSDFSDNDRAALVQLFDQQRRYGLVWEDKPEAVEETLRQYLPVLEEVPARYLPAAEASDTAHTLIEGDNLHALTVLSYTHAAQVDVIYIDPPYNTGKQDFMYNDKFVDREDGYRHSKWLSFMAKRLKLSKSMLKEKGVIFISIDDNEQAALKLLCDEVFGEENFIATIIWQKIDSPKNTAIHFSDDHEYILIYSKNKAVWRPNRLPRNEDMIARYKNPDNDSRGPWLLSDMSARNYYSLGKYPITTPSGRIIDGPPAGSYWRVSAEKFAELEKDNRVWYGPNGSNRPGIKRFLSEVRDGVIPQTLWTWNEVGSTRNAKQEFSQLMGAGTNDELFVTPKPTKLMQRILQIGAPSNATILDFFAGSGTTLHATMALNAEDGGSRRCILVTNNENNICEQVTYERNRRVIQGYTTPKGVAVPGLAHNSLRYYRCVAPVPRTPTLRHRRELVRRATDLLCLKESCYQPLPGTPADGAFRAFGSANAATVIVYDDLAVEAAAAFVATLPTPALAPAGQPWCAVYVFAPGSYAYQEEFGAVAARVRLSALPEALYRAWQHLLPQEGAMRTVEEAVISPPAPTSSPSPKKREEPADKGELDTKAEANDLADNVPAAKTDKRGNPVLF
ncbi:MAG: site-specific DNA-methyltransferase [Hymenobacter sp.]|nr:MAG: site-specific DNA-methyltransferase [Hymenobacter sp.]